MKLWPIKAGNYYRLHPQPPFWRRYNPFRTINSHKKVFFVGSGLVLASGTIVAVHGINPTRPPKSLTHGIISTQSQDPSSSSNALLQQVPPENAPEADSAPIQNGSSTNLRINGQVVPVPNNGEVHQTIEADGGQTQVDISAQHSKTDGSTSNSSSSSVQIQVNSSGGSTTTEDQ